MLQKSRMKRNIPKLKDMPVTQGMLSDFKDEVKSILTTMMHEMRAEFRKIDARFAEMESRFDKIDVRFAEMESRFDKVDARFAEMESRFDKVDARFAITEAKLDDIRGEIHIRDARFSKIDAHLSNLDSHYHRLMLLSEAQRQDFVIALDAVRIHSDTVMDLKGRVENLEKGSA
jgi:archaellum component FlaC